MQNIFRMTLPYFTETPSGNTGLSDMVLFDLVTFDRDWGRFGVGAVALLPTGADGLSAEKWGIGPAAGFTAKSGKLLWGAFNQNIFSFAGDDSMPDVNLSTLQPIASLGLGNVRSSASALCQLRSKGGLISATFAKKIPGSRPERTLPCPHCVRRLPYLERLLAPRSAIKCA